MWRGQRVVHPPISRREYLETSALQLAWIAKNSASAITVGEKRDENEIFESGVFEQWQSVLDLAN